jgi:Zn-dependent alcohol dehydrogenase
MIAAGICGAQLMELSGLKSSGPFPHIMGHEGVGIVTKVGHEVTRVKEGDKVVLHWRKGEGIESDFPTYIYNGEKITSGKLTTWAQEVTVSENRCTPVEQDVPDELCVLLGCGLSTALGTIEQEANLKMGESILIIGCGGLGMNLILAAQIRGASRIVAVDLVTKEATSFSKNLEFRFGDWNNNLYLQFDVVVDTSGDPVAVQNGVERLAPSGRLIMVGQPRGCIKIARGNVLFAGEGCSIKATQGGGFRPSVDIPRYVSAWRSGLIDLNGIITHRISLAEIERGLELVRQGNAGRVLIDL